MNSTIFKFFWEMVVNENGKLNFEIENIFVKCLCCPLRFFSKKYGQSLGAMTGLASHKSASGLGLGTSKSTPRSMPLHTSNPGDATGPPCDVRKDERLSWPSWLTCSGRFTHIVVTSRLQAERRTGPVRRPKTDVLHYATNQQRSGLASIPKTIRHSAQVLTNGRTDEQNSSSSSSSSSSTDIL